MPISLWWWHPNQIVPPTSSYLQYHIYFTNTSSTSPTWGIASSEYIRQQMYTAQQTNQLARYQAAQAANLHGGLNRPYVDNVAESYRVAERQQQRVLAAHAKTADDRAFELLLDNLTPEQKAMFKEHGFFVVEGGRSRQKYRIRKNTLVANVDVMRDGQVTHRLCAHADVRKFPLADHLLAQKLMLENDEDSFLKIANRHGR